MLKASDFPSDFVWGVSSAAAQTEGAASKDGRGPSIWDDFAKRKKVKGNQSPEQACEFYDRFEEDILLLKSLGIPNFRFSISWSRILPDGTGAVNKAGINFYHKLIDTCLQNGIEPWITLYHWDLPLALEKKGGWKNREIIHWFKDYASICLAEYGEKVKHWMLLNEPLVFTGAGYFAGYHAPGKRGMSNFLAAAYHAALAQGYVSKFIKTNYPNVQVGATFSCSFNTPYSLKEKDLNACKRVDTLLNKFFIEPNFGLGFPVKELSALKAINKHMQPGDEEMLKADFDFIGLQVYTREVIAHSFFTPYLRAKIVSASKRKVFHTNMNWEVYPDAIFEVIKLFSAYEGVKKIYITENGASFSDQLLNGRVHDFHRQDYLEKHIKKLHEASLFFPKLKGYFVWSATDNFEWTEGYKQRFGIIHINYETLERTVKDSAYWYRDFLSN